MADYELLQQRFGGWPLIQISGTAGLPPEIYRITFSVKGVYVAPSGDILERDVHVLEVNLPLTYPRRPPQCRMLTPVFHPNFDASTVCIGDFWAASEGLDELIIRIARMIGYQEYNTKSPLNALAAKWAAQNPQLLPIDARSIAPPGEAGGEDKTAAPPAAEIAAPSPLAEAAAAATESSAVTVPTADPWSNKIVIGNQG